MKPPKLEDHIAMAKNLRKAEDYLLALAKQCCEHYQKNSHVMRQLNRIGAGGYHGSAIAQLQCFLDSDYHGVVTDDQFDKLGHIYFHDPADRHL